MKNRSTIGLRVALAIGIATATVGTFAAPAGEWKAATGPLTTPWTDQVRPDNVWPEYPRPQMVRRDWQNLNGLWQFAVAKADEAPPVGKDLAEQILVPFPIESALSGVMRSAERAWYRRTFKVPDGWRGQRVLLHFGAVDWEARVWVNGKELGNHRGGYDPFDFDVTDALRPMGEQEIVVGVFDPTDAGTQPRGKQVRKPHSIWYTSTTGIWQTVWLEPVPPAHIAKLSIEPNLKRSCVNIAVSGNAEASKEHSVRITVLDGERRLTTVTGRPLQSLDVPIPTPHLWNPSDPFLYGLEVTLLRNDQPVDTIESYFGMREIRLGKDDRGVNRLLLNGEPLFQYGPLDQGFWPDGLYTPPCDAAMKFDLDKTKELGFNMVRKHVKVEPDRWYCWCDKLGLLVWQDMPSGDGSVAPGKGQITRTAESAAQFEAELAEMIDALRNHPSIVLWVVFNEGWGQFETDRMTTRAKDLDPSRIVCGASGWNDLGTGDVNDIHVYPGPGAPPAESRRAIVLGEFGGLGLPLAGHTWQNEKNWGYRNLKTATELDDGYTRLLTALRPLAAEPGLSAAVYTQTTDVEIEVNGLLSYDRRVIKLDVDRARAAAAKLYRAPMIVSEVLATSQQQPQTWRYTTDAPAERWNAADFDDRSWKKGAGGFGTEGTPGATVRTTWKSPEIWLRRTFAANKFDNDNLYLRMHYDEDAEVYINGVLAARQTGYLSQYQFVPIAPEVRQALRKGGNVLAVHCKQTGGGQYIDVGIVQIAEPPVDRQ